MEIGGTNDQRAYSLSDVAFYTRPAVPAARSGAAGRLDTLLAKLWPGLSSAVVSPRDLLFVKASNILGSLETGHLNKRDLDRFFLMERVILGAFTALEDSDSPTASSYQLSAIAIEVFEKAGGLCRNSRSVNQEKIRELKAIINCVLNCLHTDPELLHSCRGTDMSFTAHQEYLTILCQTNISYLSQETISPNHQFSEDRENVESFVKSWNSRIIDYLTSYYDFIVKKKGDRDDLIKKIQEDYDFSLEMSRIHYNKCNLLVEKNISADGVGGFKIYSFMYFPRKIQRCLLATIADSHDVINSISLGKCVEINSHFCAVERELGKQLEIIENHSEDQRFSDLSQILHRCYSHMLVISEQQGEIIRGIEFCGGKPSVEVAEKLALQFVRQLSQGLSVLKESFRSPHSTVPTIAEQEDVAEDLCLAASHSVALLRYFTGVLEESLGSIKFVRREDLGERTMARRAHETPEGKKPSVIAPADVSESLSIAQKSKKRRKRNRKRPQVVGSTTATSPPSVSPHLEKGVPLPINVPVAQSPAVMTPEARGAINGDYSKRMETSLSAPSRAFGRDFISSDDKLPNSIKVALGEDRDESTTSRVQDGPEGKEHNVSLSVDVHETVSSAPVSKRRRKRKKAQLQAVDAAATMIPSSVMLDVESDKSSTFNEPPVTAPSVVTLEERRALDGYYSRRIETARAALLEKVDRSVLLSENKRLLFYKISRCQELLESTLKRCLGEQGSDALRWQHSLSSLAEPLGSTSHVREVLQQHARLIETLDAAHSAVFYLERYDLNHSSNRRLVALLLQIRNASDVKELLAAERQVNQIMDEALQCAGALLGKDESGRSNLVEQTPLPQEATESEEPANEPVPLPISISVQNTLPKIRTEREAIGRIALCRQLIDLAQGMPAVQGPDAQQRKRERNATLEHVRRYLDWLQATLSRDTEALARCPLGVALPAVDAMHRALKEIIVAAVQHRRGGLELVQQPAQPGRQCSLLVDNNVSVTFRALCGIHANSGNRQMLDWLPVRFTEDLGWLSRIHGLLTYSGSDAKQQEEVYALVVNIQECEALRRKLARVGADEGWSLAIKGKQVSLEKVEERLKHYTDQLPSKVLYPALDALYLILRGAF